LVGTLLLGICPPLAAPVLWLAAKLAHAQWRLFEMMATWPGAHWYLPEVHLWAMLLALVGALWLFMPRGVPLRWLGLLLFLPLLLPRQPLLAEGAFEVWVLDVGQGLSVLLRTRDHTLLYDAGARYPSGFDLGAAVVLPSMHSLGITRLDVLMISHGDNDHAGGAVAVASAFPLAHRYAGEPGRMRVPMEPCHAGQSWRWNGVSFRVLHPPVDAVDRDNDSSCVLLVESDGGRLLLTGDISSSVEPQVAAAVGAGPPPVLVVPHHGSRTSSSPAFIAALKPSLALVSAGWHNRFGHPRPEVVARYRQAAIPLLDTADDGAIEVAFVPGAWPQVIRRWRFASRRYWRE
jgi:competence protein ComEC